MALIEIVNSYCFNPGCDSSIFRSPTFSGVSTTINNVLSGPLYCKDCNSEMVAKAQLEIKSEINISLATTHKPLQALIIDDDAFFHMMIEHSLKKELSMTETKCCYNGEDAIDYLKTHRHLGDYLPDLVFVDICMPLMDGWGFLETYEKIHHLLDKTSDVYVISGYIEPSYREKTRKYDFVKGLIEKPFQADSLKHVSENLLPVL